MDDERSENPGLMVIEGSVTPSAAPVATAPREFSDLQWAFINAYCSDDPELGGRGEASAIAAGYAGGAKNMATRNLLNPKVQAEIERRVKAGRGTMLLLARNRLADVLVNGTNEVAVVSASLGVMDRFGMGVPKGPLIDARTVNVNAGDASAVLQQVAQRFAERQARLG